MWFSCITLAFIVTLGSAKKEFYDDFIDDDFIPFTGDRKDHFDWELCSALDEREPGNIIASPVSVKLLLAILYEASTGRTSHELQRILQLDTSRSVTRVAYSALLKTLQAPNTNYDLEIGIRVYLDKRFHPKNWYKNVLAQYYGTYLQGLNFRKSASAANEINNWVDFATHGHIKNLISDGETLKESSLLLVNAIYFQGQWKNPFPVAASYTGVFFSPNGLKPARFMSQTGLFYYSESNELDAQLLRLPYKGRKFAMYILLPKRQDGLNQVLSKVRPFVLRRQIWQLEENSVSVTLPIFKFEFNMNLKNTLIDIGVSSIFNHFDELRGISGTRSKNVSMVVSNIIQKAAIVVNERGTTAAAATEMQFINKLGIPELSFNASHPFLFFIEDEVSGTVIFEGKFVHPEITSADLDIPPTTIAPTSPPSDNEPINNELDRFINHKASAIKPSSTTMEDLEDTSTSDQQLLKDDYFRRITQS